MKSKQSPLVRINRIIKHLTQRRCNSERVNKVYRNIINLKLENK